MGSYLYKLNFSTQIPQKTHIQKLNTGIFTNYRAGTALRSYVCHCLKNQNGYLELDRNHWSAQMESLGQTLCLSISLIIPQGYIWSRSDRAFACRQHVTRTTSTACISNVSGNAGLATLYCILVIIIVITIIFPSLQSLKPLPSKDPFCTVTQKKNLPQMVSHGLPIKWWRCKYTKPKLNS